MSSTRQIRKNEETKAGILDCARKIIETEGIEGLSIRKITNAMEYSPGIVYHYFKNKREILDYILHEGYEHILSSIKPPAANLLPDEVIRISIRNYINGALTWSVEWKAFMFSSEASILAFTSILAENSSEKREALAGLCKAIEAGVSMGLFAPCDIELTAQAVWSGMFGLLGRLIIEGNIEEAQKDRLLERQLDILIKGILR